MTQRNALLKSPAPPRFIRLTVAAIIVGVVVVAWRFSSMKPRHMRAAPLAESASGIRGTHSRSNAAKSTGHAAKRQAPSSAGKTALPTVSVPIGKMRFTLEVAATAGQQSLGLMFRKSMPQNHGMIFVIRHAKPEIFWMKNTLFPLDLLYLDQRGKIIMTYRMAANGGSRHLYDSFVPIKYAIEINAGLRRTLRIRDNEVIKLPFSALIKATARADESINGRSAAAGPARRQAR